MTEQKQAAISQPLEERVFYVATNFHSGRIPEHLDELTPAFTNMTFPGNVTLGFRGLFWTAFTRLFRQTFLARPEVEFAGLNWRISSVCLFEVYSERFPVLEDRQTRYILLVAAKPDRDISVKELNAHTFAQGMNEQAFIKGFFQNLATCPSLDWLDTFKHDRDFPARIQFTFRGRLELQDTGSALAGFYFLAQLLIWQAQREIAQIDVSLVRSSAQPSIRNALSARQKLIEIERLFLTKNISNDSSLKAFASNARKRLRLRMSFDGLMQLNEAIERFHLSASALRQERQTRRLTLIATAVAILGIPISFVSMMMAISDTNFVVRHGILALSEPSLGQTLALLSGGAVLATLVIALFVWIFTARR
ncbi:hypothetical protein [Maricaulis maris]|uniref:hypothetical protein n=1 Tax=Maricaulis maris TaxID=74318 RepID=UPI003B8CE611